MSKYEKLAKGNFKTIVFVTGFLCQCIQVLFLLNLVNLNFLMNTLNKLSEATTKFKEDVVKTFTVSPHPLKLNFDKAAMLLLQL